MQKMKLFIYLIPGISQLALFLKKINSDLIAVSPCFLLVAEFWHYLVIKSRVTSLNMANKFQYDIKIDKTDITASLSFQFQLKYQFYQF